MAWIDYRADGNPDPRRHASRILYGPERAAACSFSFGGALLPDLKGDANDVVALLNQQRRRDRGVHPAAHRHHHFFFLRAHGD